jgi:hypothetical protein
VTGSYSDVFGGQNIFPAQLTLLILDIAENVGLQWPVEQALPDADVFADIIEVTATAGLSITMPDARNASNGQSTLINNVGAQTVSILDNEGNNIGSVASGEIWQFYLQDNTTQGGTWRTFEFGAGSSSAVAAALAGAGLKAITTTLNVKIAPTVTPTTPLAILNADRAEAFVFTGGVGAWSLPNPATVGSDWFTYVRNGGTGNLTLTPAAGLINGAASLVYAPGDSSIIITDGTNYYTIGFVSGTTGEFDYTSINVAGTGNYVLAGTELDRKSYRFTGALSGARNVVVPASVQEYWCNNQTNGAFALTVKTLAGTGVVVPQGYALILSCDGTNVVAWEGDPTTGVIPVPLGGLGLTAVAQGGIPYGSAANVYSILAKDTNATRYISNTGASNNPAWAQVDLTNGVTGRLPYANLAQGSALSVLGVAGAAVANVASIVGAASQVLRINDAGNALAFGAVNLAMSAAVTGVLGAVNGGTDQSAVAQGDLLYGSAANLWSRLPKNSASGLKFLANNGGGVNNPNWLTPQFTGNVQFSADYTLVLGDSWRIAYHDSVTPHRLTIPANGTTAFEIGTYIGFCNPSASGALTIAIGGPDNITGHGNATGTGDFIVIPPGYSGYVIKVLSQLWLLVTDAPPTVVSNILYRGYVGADGTTGNRFSHAGWSAARTGTGAYTVTHNLGLADGTRLSIGMSVFASAGNRTGYSTSANDGNQFFIGITDAGAGTASDQAFSFVAATN